MCGSLIREKLEQNKAAKGCGSRFVGGRSTARINEPQQHVNWAMLYHWQLAGDNVKSYTNWQVMAKTEHILLIASSA